MSIEIFDGPDVENIFEHEISSHMHKKYIRMLVRSRATTYRKNQGLTRSGAETASDAKSIFTWHGTMFET